MRTTNRSKAPLGGTVTLDKHWARALGADQLAGARRTGDFYRVPRTQLRKLEAVSPTLEWTPRDDLAVATLLAESAEQSEPCADCPR